MYMKSVCFSAFILHISGTDKCKIGVRYIIFRPVLAIYTFFIITLLEFVIMEKSKLKIQYTFF
jgi:hypothetical protein